MEQEKILKDAQYRKGLSIAFFNATNAAIALVASEERLRFGEEIMITNVRKFRDIFLQDHQEYYATVIANVGQNYKVEDAINKLKSAKTEEELKLAWRLLSEDERRDSEIVKVAQELKKKYAKNEKVQ